MMLISGCLWSQVLRFPGSALGGHGADEAQAVPYRSQDVTLLLGRQKAAGNEKGRAEAAAGGPETGRDMAGASLSQLMDALSAAILRDTYVRGDSVLLALAEAAVLEREFSCQVPRRWRVQQALNALLKMGPYVTVALAAVLEHPSARAHIAHMFCD